MVLNLLSESTSIFHQIIDLVVTIIFDNNFEYQTYNCTNLYIILEKYIEIFDKKFKLLEESEEYQLLEKVKCLISMGLSLYDVMDVESLFLEEIQLGDNEIKEKNTLYDKYKKYFIKSLKFYLSYFIANVTTQDT